MGKPLGGGRAQKQQDSSGQQEAEGDELAGASEEVTPASPARTAAGAPPKAAPKSGPSPGREVEVKWYRVKADAEVSNRQGRTRMPAGKVLRSTSYDIPGLISAGVQLEEVEEPAWSSSLREAAED